MPNPVFLNAYVFCESFQLPAETAGTGFCRVRFPGFSYYFYFFGVQSHFNLKLNLHSFITRNLSWIEYYCEQLKKNPGELYGKKFYFFRCLFVITNFFCSAFSFDMLSVVLSCLWILFCCCITVAIPNLQHSITGILNGQCHEKSC